MSEEEKRRWRKPPVVGADASRGSDERLRKGTRTPSSRWWLERQLNDPYVRRAKAEGWRSRAAFKLLELDDRFDLIRKGALVADLGAAPGGWSEAALKRGASRVVGIDLLPIEPMEGAEFLQLDMSSIEAPVMVRDRLGGAPALVLSDMAANTTGHKGTDQMRTGALAELACRFALQTLAPGGAFVTKAFQGGLDAALLTELKQAFEKVRHAKPPASRSESPEVYVVAQGFRPGHVGEASTSID